MNNYTFLVKWIDPKETPHVVGVLSRQNDIYYFRYNSKKEILESAKKEGFKWVPSFWDENKIYSSKTLFGFFKSRIDDACPQEDEAKAFEENAGKCFTDHYYLERID